MFNPTEISEIARHSMEKSFKAIYPKLELEYSPAFRHYYVYNTETKQKSDNISLYEMNMRVSGLVVMKNLKERI